ncbi:MAG: M20/M25/M40 family metallo-hydrolase [Ignavibacteriae bacterium]|nr:M20/M25/M40 family metallo-hydrolase [Ignavibacteriota bacterium]
MEKKFNKDCVFGGFYQIIREFLCFTLTNNNLFLNINKLFIMKPFKLFTLLFIFLISSTLFAQVSYNTFVANIMNQVSQDSVYLFERQLCGDTSCIIGGSPYTIVSRHYNTTSNPKAAQFIYEKFQSFGLTTWYQNINSTLVNVLAKKTGTKYPNQYVIICAHYDDMPSGTTAPGADDNASGTIAVLEAARLLKNVNLPYTIVFAAWDEEERGLYGSKAYADTAFAHGDSIIAVLNFDMIAYDGNNDGALDVNTNTASTPLANDFAQIVSLYQPTLVPQVTTSLNGGSDHQSFQTRGYKAILSIEDNDDFTPYYHTVNDTYASLSKAYFVKMIKAGIAALVTIAGDFKITIQHTPISTGPSTSSRIATAVIKSSYKIATGTNQPRLYYSINNGPYSFLTPSYSNQDTVKFTIPEQSLGTTVKYYIAAQDSAGTLIATLPSGGTGVNPPGTTPPSTQFTYQVANIAIINIGTGTLSSNYPFTTYWMDGRTQMLFLASEISTDRISGTISKIGFNVISNSTQVMNGFNVRIQNTVATSLTGWVQTGWTTCFSGTYTVPGTGWQYIDMQTPYWYNGTSNLLIEVCYDNSSYTSYSPVNATSNSGKTFGYYTDNTTGCTMTSGAVQSNRPNISLYMTGPGPTGIGNQTTGIPKKFDMKQNYPNPFNPVTKIQYEVPKASYVTIKVYDILGREVATLVNTNMEAGYFMYDFDASALSSGVYIYKMTAGTFEKTMRMMVVK